MLWIVDKLTLSQKYLVKWKVLCIMNMCLLEHNKRLTCLRLAGISWIPILNERIGILSLKSPRQRVKPFTNKK